MATRYVTVDTLKSYMRSELALEDDAYEAAINYAEAMIDNACRRRFDPVADDAVATARSFRSSGSGSLYISDCTVITSVVDNGTTLTVDSDYWAEPLPDGGEVWPYFKLSRPSGWWYPSYPTGLVTVTAKWGWPAIPAPIIEAVKVLAKDACQQREIKFGLVAVSDSGGVGARENRIVRDAINVYMHPNAAMSMLSA